jgi:hypothetical protein
MRDHPHFFSSAPRSLRLTVPIFQDRKGGGLSPEPSPLMVQGVS